MTTRMVLKPQTLDVMVATNLHADILSDLAAALAGSLGIAPTANLNPERKFPSMFEPIHGSAFDITGKGMANPDRDVLDRVDDARPPGRARRVAPPHERDRARHRRAARSRRTSAAPRRPSTSPRPCARRSSTRRSRARSSSRRSRKPQQRNDAMTLKRPDLGARGRVVVLEHDSKILRGNPLGDPHVRKLAVWLPPQYDEGATRGRGPALPGALRPGGLHGLGPRAHRLEELQREHARARRAPDPREGDGAGDHRLPRLLHGARRQPVRQLLGASATTPTTSRRRSCPSSTASSARSPRASTAAASANPRAATAPSSTA